MTARAFDSADVKFAFDRARDPKSTNAQKQIFAPIASIETPDPATVMIKLKETSGNFLYYLGWGDAVIVAPETAATNTANPVGTGPFKFKSWTRGDRVELVRNPDYWQKDKMKLDSVTFRFISDSQAQVAAVEAGDVDAFPNLAAPELFAEFQKDPRFKAVAGNTEGETVAGMNNAKKPFDDVRVRRALMHAIDRKALVEGAYSGFGQPIGSFFSPNHPAFVDMTNVIPYDVEKAKALLKEAGYGNGLSITIKTPQMAYASRSAELISAMLSEVGVDLKIIPTEFPAKWIEEVFKNKDYDITIVVPHRAARHRYLRPRHLLLQLQERQVQGRVAPKRPRPPTRRRATPNTPRPRRSWPRTCPPSSCSSCRSSACGTRR